MSQIVEVVRNARNAAFKIDSQGHEYVTTRSLKGDVMGLDGYNQSLPQWNGQNVQEVIQTLVDGMPDDTKVNLLDLGCGRGDFLLDSEFVWEERVSLDGLTTYPYDENRLFTQEGLLSDGIRKLVGDVQNLPRFFPKNSYDVLVSCAMFPYVADPWSVLKKMYDALKPQGYGFISGFPQVLEGDLQEDNERVTQFMQNRYGFVCERDQEWDKPYYKFSFRKWHKRLKLPLVYSGGVRDVDFCIPHRRHPRKFESYSIQRLTYRIAEDALD